ncbi:hypothetical protein Q3G72_003353 [Acer saccharum]|nr:hypothetical protein Q3G72_003353 [Acer saccharum]
MSVHGVEMGMRFVLLLWLRASRGSTVKKGNKDSNQTWVVPRLGTFKLNVDVAFNTINGRFGAGLVFRDDRGLIVDAAAVRLNGSGSVEVAEAGAILEGFSLAVGLMRWGWLICEWEGFFVERH